MLRRASECAETNAPLREYACAVLDDPGLASRLQGDPAFVLDELSWALHFGVALEIITAASVASADFRSAVHWQMTLIASRIYDRIKIHVQVGRPRDRQYFKQLEVAFKKQKWHSVEAATRDLELIHLQNDGSIAVRMQLQLAMNILEASHLELVDGVHSNVELGLALAVGAQGALPSVDDQRRLWWPLGKEWADAYVVWNLEYVTHFETVHHPTKLLIPSLLCSDPHAGHFIDARTFSLKLFMVYYTNRRDRNYLLFPADDPNGAGSRGNGVWNATLTERRRWAQISLERSRLPRPSPTKYGHGSVTRLFDALKPPHGWLEVFTSQVQDEWFLLYATVVVWLTVIIAGFGSELVLGEQIVRRSAVNHEWTSVMWHAAQLAFSLCLTVALFAHSAIGLPFLVLGLWKMGFPETLACFLRSYLEGWSLEGLCLFLDGSGFILHHTTTAFTIVALTTGLFPPTQQIIGCCVIPVMQHWFVCSCHALAEVSAIL